MSAVQLQKIYVFHCLVEILQWNSIGVTLIFDWNHLLRNNFSPHCCSWIPDVSNHILILKVSSCWNSQFMSHIQKITPIKNLWVRMLFRTFGMETTYIWILTKYMLDWNIWPNYAISNRREMIQTLSK